MVQIEDNNDHPKFVWGPYPGNAPISHYKLYRSGNYPVGNRPDPPYPNLVTVTYQVYDYIDASVTISGNINMRSYYLTGRTGGIELETPLTNLADVYLLRQSKTSGELTDNKYELRQNYPNPFNPQTIISFSIAEQSRVNLKIYDIIGREVKTLVNDNLEPGNYTFNFNAEDLSSGIYFYRLSAGKYS